MVVYYIMKGMYPSHEVNLKGNLEANYATYCFFLRNFLIHIWYIKFIIMLSNKTEKLMYWYHIS